MIRLMILGLICGFQTVFPAVLSLEWGPWTLFQFKLPFANGLALRNIRLPLRPEFLEPRSHPS